MSQAIVSEITGYRLQLPLTVPYRWRGGLIRHFDAVLVVLRSEDGRTGIGEGTPVPGYSFETVEDVWEIGRAHV